MDLRKASLCAFPRPTCSHGLGRNPVGVAGRDSAGCGQHPPLLRVAEAGGEWRREIQPGVCVGQLVRPLESVGCYVPGGRYPLPSTLLMTVIPAQVAGVQQIRVTSPRPAQGNACCCRVSGRTRVLPGGWSTGHCRVGLRNGEHPRVDKIVGPGNRYVTAAKKVVAFDCAIDFLAGPTESVIVSENGDPAGIASDLVAQAEHDPDALCVLVTPSRELAGEVAKRSEDPRVRKPDCSPVTFPARRDSSGGVPRLRRLL